MTGFKSELAAYFTCFYLLTAVAVCQDNSHPANSTGKPLNVVFILSDDHRYDMMGFMDTVSYLKTPAMDRMAKQGAHIQNAFVNTSLCSPSRASILTGQYTHRHGVVDNKSAVPDSAVFFPQYLQKAGYETGFVGKWHMGRPSAEPRRGFDYWVSFRRQGRYYGPTLNENGKKIGYSDSTYISELLTNKALNFLQNRAGSQRPFFLYLSHKAVHATFKPAPRDKGKYRGKPIDYPATMFPPSFELADTVGKGYDPKTRDLPKNRPDFDYNYKDLPEWVKERRHSRHGVNHIVNDISYDEFYYRYLETVLSIDRSIGRVLNYLEKQEMLDSTLVVYMGDNGYSFGEHGLIDKRHAYEESWRVPMLVYAPGMIEPGTKVTSIVQNIDVAPTILDLAGIQQKSDMDGRSFLSSLKGQEKPNGKERIFYEYYWESIFPQTPTMLAVRTDSFKFIKYYGIWDDNELYNIAKDPKETNNLIHHPKYQDKADSLNQAIFDWLQNTDGMQIPLRPDRRPRFDRKARVQYDG